MCSCLVASQRKFIFIGFPQITSLRNFNSLQYHKYCLFSFSSKKETNIKKISYHQKQEIGTNVLSLSCLCVLFYCYETVHISVIFYCVSLKYETLCFYNMVFLY